MIRPKKLVWVLTGFVLLGSGACSSDPQSDVIAVGDVGEGVSISNLSLRVRGMT